jgi:hypothetical protein
MSDPVYVHIGLGKTGTTTIQRALHECREPLLSHGIEVAGQSRRDTRRAVYDLMGRRISHGDNAGVSGAFEPWAASIATSRAKTVVCSEEMLALARPGHVRRLVSAVAPRRLVVIVTVRELGSVLVSSWQQSVMMGRAETLEQFLAAVRNPVGESVSVGVAFWLREDLERVLDTWGRRVPAEDFRIVVVPRWGDPWPLEDRFGSVIGAPNGLLRLPQRANASPGGAEVEVVRRLNVHVRLEENHRLYLTRVLRRAFEDRPMKPVRLPGTERSWVDERSEGWSCLIRDRGYPLVGSLDELTPPVGQDGHPTGEEVADATVADLAIAALAALSRDHGRLWAKHRKHQEQAQRSGWRLGSGLRVVKFRAKTAALAHADRNRLFAWGARAYLKATSRH